MKTSREISTISYNTKDYLVSKLDAMLKRHNISYYAFIYHKAEADETKDHIHLYIIPNGQIDTDNISKELEQIDPNPDPKTNPENKPLGCKPWRKSKWEDWYLYAIHDKAYLMKKGQTRKNDYKMEDIVSSDHDYMLELIHTIDYAKYKGLSAFIDRIKNGASLPDLIYEGVIPPQQFVAYREMYYIITQQVRHDTPYRNGRQTHTPNCDPETGEVIEDTNEV